MKMENGTKKENVKKHIGKLHERIQLKFEEMQKKLEKSKSIDILSDLNDEYDFHHRKFVSVSDLSKLDLLHNVSVSRSNSYIETIALHEKKIDASCEEITYKEASITTSDSISNLYEKVDSDNENNVENEFFHKDFFKTSLESLNEVTKESDDSSGTFTPPPRSIRDRIESRLKKRNIERREKKARKQQESREKIEKLVLCNTGTHRSLKLYKRQKIATVTIALIEVTGLEETFEEKRVSFRLRLGQEKRKSKVIKSNSSKVKFQELFNMTLNDDDDNILEITFWDKDNLMGRNILDLSSFENDKTHKMHLNLDGELKNTNYFFLLTITGTLANTVYDVDEDELKRKEDHMKTKYAWYRINDQITNVGMLSIIIYGAKGLSGHDCYCVVTLNNQRIQTQTDYKTQEPSWMKIMSFMVTDITSILEVTVIDEKKSEEIGKIAIPLLNIKSGKKWYALKDSTLKERAKGNNARILLEMNVIWNLIKAATRVINPKEPNYLVTEKKLDRHIFARHLSRAKIVFSWIINAFKTMKSCFEWESTRSNIIALFIWIMFCMYVQIWMFPLLLLIPFIWYKPDRNKSESLQLEQKNEKDDKSVTLRQKINSIQEIILSIQNIIGTFARTGESIKNLFNFTVPFVSFLAIFFLIVISLIMYLIPLNYICIIWGIHKFTRKIIKPNRIPNNEILDLLSRVPDDEILGECEELPLGEVSDDNE